MAWVDGLLLPGESALWRRQAVADRRHTVLVARRFADRRRDASRDEIAGALLHDVGKVDSGLGPIGRTIATVVGPLTTSMRSYHEHERIGLELARLAGSTAVTLELLAWRGPAADALRDADDC